MKKCLVSLLVVIMMMATIGTSSAVTIVGEASTTPTEANPTAAVNGGENAFVDGDVELGSILYFGWYKEEPIRWYVVERTESEATLLAVELIEVKQYHSSKERTPWGQSALCCWLNEAFVNEAFNLVEFTSIVPMEIDGVQCYATIPSKEEIESWKVYIGNDLHANGTAYSRQNGLYIGSKTGCSPYWLRTNETSEYASFVGADSGKIYVKNNPPTSTDNGVRPVIHVQVR